MRWRPSKALHSSSSWNCAVGGSSLSRTPPPPGSGKPGWITRFHRSLVKGVSTRHGALRPLRGCHAVVPIAITRRSPPPAGRHGLHASGLTSTHSTVEGSKAVRLRLRPGRKVPGPHAGVIRVSSTPRWRGAFQQGIAEMRRPWGAGHRFRWSAGVAASDSAPFGRWIVCVDYTAGQRISPR